MINPRGVAKPGIDKCAPEDCSTCSSDCASSKINLNERVIELTTDDGEKQKCLIVLKYKMGIRDYCACMPLLNNPECDIYLYRMVKNGTELQNIENEEEYSKAAVAFGIEMEKAQKNKQ